MKQILAERVDNRTGEGRLKGWLWRCPVCWHSPGPQDGPPDKTCRNCGEPLYDALRDEDRYEVISLQGKRVCRLRQSDGKQPAVSRRGVGGRAVRPTGGKRPDLNNIYFRSAWEANVARYLRWLVDQGEISGWLYEPPDIEFWFQPSGRLKGIRRGVRSYRPDFIVFEYQGLEIGWTIKADGRLETMSAQHDSGESIWAVTPDCVRVKEVIRTETLAGRAVIWEVKAYLDSKSRTALTRMGRYFPNVRLEVINRKRYREISKEVSSLIGGWE